MKEAVDQAINLCNFCEYYGEFPTCMPDDEADIKFGCGQGNDNIYACINYKGDETILIEAEVV